MADHRLKILVVGGGLCGLAVAISCSLAGHDVTVFEAVAQLHEIGAGIQITPNAVRLLHQWGLWERMAPAAVEPSELIIRRFDGRLLAQRRRYDEEIRRNYGFPVWCLHRVDMQAALAQRATELGVDIRLGRRVHDIDFDQTVLKLADGETAAGDVIVAADGLWSSTRSRFLGVDTPPKPTGDLAYRVVLRADEMEDPELLAVVKTPSVNFWFGPSMHIIGYNLRSTQAYNIVFSVPDDLPEGVRKQPGDVAELRKLIQNWDPILSRLIAGVEKVDKWKLMHHPALDQLATESGQFFMAGDSCHPMLPYFAQGASSSLEDAAVLGHLLSKVSSLRDLQTVSKVYSKIRRERVSHMQDNIFIHRNEIHLPDGPEQVKRDELWAKSFTVESWKHPDLQHWLYSYDAYQAAEEAYMEARLA